MTEPKPAREQTVLRGIPLSPGIAVGQVHRVEHSFLDTPEYRLSKQQVVEEQQRFAGAVSASQGQYQVARNNIPQGGIFHRELSCILDAHCMMLEDPSLLDGVMGIIKKGCNAEWAVRQYLNRMMREFAKVEDPYLQEKRLDVEQVCKRLLVNLVNIQPIVFPTFSHPVILVSEDFSPADILLMTQQMVAGFAMEVGGPTSHSAIFAKSLGIPAVGCLVGLTSQVRSYDRVIVDGLVGEFILNPCDENIKKYEVRQRNFNDFRVRMAAEHQQPAQTLDGCRIVLKANIERSEEALQAMQVGAEGVGLYRTDHLFLSHQGPVPEEVQFQAYCQVLQTMQGRGVAFRTVDMRYHHPVKGKGEEWVVRNPALGLRAVRYSMRKERPQFISQLRGILRAAAVGGAEILFPMIASVAELQEILTLLEETRGNLVQEGKLADTVRPRVGIMVEVPAAALCATQLVGMVDFINIGTNDLVQYTLAVDREDEEVADLYDPAHPAVLRLIGMTVEAAHAQGRRVSVCGEMAADPRYALLLLGLGVDELSVSPVCLPVIRRLVQSIDMAKALEMVKMAISGKDPKALHCQLEALVQSRLAICQPLI